MMSLMNDDCCVATMKFQVSVGPLFIHTIASWQLMHQHESLMGTYRSTSRMKILPTPPPLPSSSFQLLAVLPLAAVHTLGNLFTNMSLGKVAVSFTHTIKAMEPFFSVLLSSIFLGDVSR